MDGQPDSDIVDPGASQPVHLVDDDVADVSLLDQTRQQCLQCRPVSRTGRCAGVDVLVDHLSAKLARFAPAGIPLRRNRVALRLAAGAGLPGRADAQVDDGSTDSGDLIRPLVWHTHAATLRLLSG